MQKGLQEFTVKAPKAGMVIYKRNWDAASLGVGGMINAWDNVVAELPNLKEMISKTYVNEIDISKVKTGQPVKIGMMPSLRKNSQARSLKSPISASSSRTAMPKYTR